MGIPYPHPAQSKARNEARMENKFTSGDEDGDGNKGAFLDFDLARLISLN